MEVINKDGNLGNQAISLAIQLGVGYVFGKQNAKKNKELENRLLALNQIQINELEQKLNAVNTELKKTEILYQYLNKVDFENRKKQLNKQRINLILSLGVGVIVLILIFNKLKNKNG